MTKKHRSRINGKRTKLYERWQDMRKRVKREPTYLAKGIKVCERWDDFQNFAEDMGGKVPEGMWLERIDNHGDYEPSNCCWASPKEQCRNRSTNRLLTANGETKFMSDWAEELGTAPATIWLRLKRGWSEQQACTEPVGRNVSGKGRFVEYKGLEATVAEHCRIHGAVYGRVLKRLQSGWSVEDAFEKPVGPNGRKKP